MASIEVDWTNELEWYCNQPKAHPDTTGWGSSERGRNWFCTTHTRHEEWDGTKILAQERGSETITAGQASKTVNHNLGSASFIANITPTNEWLGKWIVSITKTSTTFVITVSDALHDGLNFDYLITT